MEVSSHITNRNSRPFIYKKGTRVTTLKVPDNVYFFPPEYVLFAIGVWRDEWNDESTDTEDLFITVAFSSFETIVEVSDMFRFS